MNLETMRIHSKAPLPGTEPLPRRGPFNPFLLCRLHGGFPGVAPAGGLGRSDTCGFSVAP